jgi:hypothetical protein
VRLPIAISSAALLVAACATSRPPPPPPPPVEMNATGVAGQAAGTRTTLVTATVTAVDVAKRTVTLQSSRGEKQTIEVPPEVKRLAEVSPGDVVHAELNEGLLLEYQAPGTEKPEPESVVAVGGGVAGAGSAPGAAAGGGIQDTVVVVAIDPKTREVKFQTPAGNEHKVKAGPKVQLEKLKVGDRLLATYVQTVAVRLEKAGATGAK